MKKFTNPQDGASKGAALIIVLAFIVLLTAFGLTYFSRTTTDRQLAQSSSNDTTADLLARSALDITVSDLKQEIAINQPVRSGNVQPLRYGAPPITDPSPIPNLIRRSFQGDPTNRTSGVRSTDASADGRSISRARWNSHYLIPRASTGIEIDSTPLSSFIAPDWVLVTPQGPKPTPAPNEVIGRYAFAVYDEGGLIDMNLGGFPTYASLTRPTLPSRPAPATRRLAAKYPLEESEIMPIVCQAPNFTPDHINESLSTGVPFSITPNTNHNPTSFGVSWLPHGLSLNTATGRISGTPTSPGTFTVTLTCSNGCPPDGTATLHLMITGSAPAESTPWPVNLARKGTLAFADLTTLPSTPTVITPTTPVGSMGGFPSPAPINKLMGWRNYATTQQPTSASFDSPSFLLASADNYARYFIGNPVPPYFPPYTTPFTTVSTAVQNQRTDQGTITRQELIKLQRTIGFSQSLLQYLGTFSRESNRPAPDWPQLNGKLPARWDMNNLAIVIPNSWIWPGHHGVGHAYGLQRQSEIAQLFGLVWENGTFAPGTRDDDPNYYGRWRYIGRLSDNNNPPLQGPDPPDFFQIIDYAMNQAIGYSDPNHLRHTFEIGAALIDQYDTDDLYDAPVGGADSGNTITIINYDDNPFNYVYGIEGMSFDDPTQNEDRPPFAPYPPPVPANYVLLNRRFENVGEFGYAHNPASTMASKTLNFASSTSPERAMLDFFTYNTAGTRAGIVNLNTRNGPVLASIISGALLADPGSENTPTALASRGIALAAAQAIVRETATSGAGRGPAVTRADVARLTAAAFAAVPGLAASDEAKKTVARALAEIGQARTWNLMIDVIAQTGKYAPGTPNLSNPAKFIVEGEKRYWLHIALDRDIGTVLGTQLEEVLE
jgi:Putative Ig domain